MVLGGIGWAVGQGIKTLLDCTITENAGGCPGLTGGKRDINPGRKDPKQRRTTQVSEPGPSTASQDPLLVLQNGSSLSAHEVANLLRTNASLAGNFSATSSQADLASPQTSGFYDPYQFGRNTFSTKKRHVVDFILSLSRGEETDSVTLGGVEVKSTATRKLQHKKLTAPQYMEGALLILRAMVIEHGINLGNSMDFVNYLIQVVVFAQSFIWTNALSYDKDYRQEQHELSFIWGIGSPVLMTSLRPPHPLMSGRNLLPTKPHSHVILNLELLCQKLNVE